MPALGLALPFRSTAPFNPATLFASSQQGGWYDPADAITNWRKNLLTRSEEFENAAWAKNRATVTPNAVNGPFGTLTADKLIEDTTASNTHTVTNQVTGLTAGVTYTFSVYARSSERTRVTLGEGNNTTGAATFDLSNGTIVTVSGNGSPAASISDAGGGWYRCALTLTLIGTVHNCQIYLNNGAGVTYTGDGTSGIFIWGGQLELGTTATTYQRITDVNSDFLAAFPNYTLFQDSAGTTPVTALGQPVGRINDKSGRGNHLTQTTAASRPTLEARVNLLTRTEEFDNAAWSALGTSSVTPNSAVAPDGTTTADTITDSGAADFGGRSQTVSIPAAALTYTFGLSVRKTSGGTSPTFGVNYSFTGGTPQNTTLRLNTDTGASLAAGGVVANVIDAGSYWRISLTLANNATNTSCQVAIYPATNANGTLNADSSATTGSAIVWGAQLELGSTPTTYQRVTTATDYTDIGAPRYLQFDGVDDFLTIGTFNMSASDKVAVCAGVRKLSDANTQILTELSVSSPANNGSFDVRIEATQPRWYWNVRGTLSGGTNSGTGYAAPVTNVLALSADIAVDTTPVRVNGVLTNSTSADLGTGNFGAAYPLFVGRRGGTTLPFQGNVYGLVIRGGSITATETAQLERFMANRTGIAI